VRNILIYLTQYFNSFYRVFVISFCYGTWYFVLFYFTLAHFILLTYTVVRSILFCVIQRNSFKFISFIYHVLSAMFYYRGSGFGVLRGPQGGAPEGHLASSMALAATSTFCAVSIEVVDTGTIRWHHLGHQ
jgi:hypothetical protein